MMAFRIAWFKVHHPLPFYAAYFYRRSQKGGFDAVLMTHGIDTVVENINAIEKNEDATAKDEDLLTTLEVAYEFYLRGFEFLPISIYDSHATKFLVKDGKLLPPFVAISGLGESACLGPDGGAQGKDLPVRGGSGGGLSQGVQNPYADAERGRCLWRASGHQPGQLFLISHLAGPMALPKFLHEMKDVLAFLLSI